MKAPIVELSQLTKGFSDGDQYHKVLDRVELQLQPGDTVALQGPSGSGKSTLLNLIAGFERPDSGRVLFEQQATDGWRDRQWSAFRRQQLGMVFQQFNLLTPLNAADNIAFSLHLINQPWNAWCDHLVSRLGLAPLLERKVEHLSGGQQQRVAIARALAHKPRLLLADEPTGNLDAAAGQEVMALLCELAEEAATTVLLVTHSQACADFMRRRWRLELGAIHE
ncbi:ABC transporter ATP-binding protein [Shewanella sp. AS16]|uniref:ABC transporter ATP-binding protein n=1 Tax=Shewanella sp. AS16 TaxID=2907625 RepID=UPI001F329417|nr:ABC transporter ATP-binding protein [Shewanella sp. AS16]MCE9686131.1 ABC transporter ATP-binding protein [Shewanella sp. AS16]